MKKKWICLIMAAVLLFSCCPAAGAAYAEMSFSDDIVEFIKKGEGFTASPYYSGGYWFIGYGCLINPADYPNGITEEGAEALLRDNMQKFADYINGSFLKKYDVGVTQCQFDAMIAMCYALGTSWLSPANRLPSYLIKGIGNYSDREIACAFAAWCHIGGGINIVALQRRIMEARIFLDGDYSFERYGAALGWNWLILDPGEGENDLSDVAVYRTGEPYGELPTASRRGWYFAGWEKADGTLLLPTDVVERNLDLKARWSLTPVTPPQPDVPDEPEGPVEPNEPDVPDEPEEPVEPNEPDEPDKPDEPDVPDEPEEPDEPEGPVEPNEPDEPDVPEELPEEVFPDVAVTAWYARYVAQLVSAGVVNGYNDGLFRPQSDVTWGEALKLILRASGFNEQPPAEATDRQPKPHWASGYLQFAVDKGYLAAGSVGDLNAPITRNALADLCAAALELSETPAENPFADTAGSSALKLYAAGIMEGSVGGDGLRSFKGEDRLTRAEICAVLVRVQSYVASKWILFKGYRVPINNDLARNPYDPAAFSEKNGRKSYDDGVIKARLGVDVSYYQGEVDWAKVAADGIEFAIIRCGYRAYGTGALAEDPYFRRNIQGALENGLEVGVYFFSQALSVQEAMEELNYTLELIRGWNVTLPVVFDWEQIVYNGSRTRTPNWSVVADCIVAFCDGVTAAGYRPMTYYMPTMAYLYLDLPRLARFPKWLAHYVDVTDYYYDFQMWQYGSSGQVNGIDGRVDMDLLFTDFA